MHDMEDFTIVAGKPGICVALTKADHRPAQENEANARLIVSAVNQREELLGLLERWELVTRAHPVGFMSERRDTALALERARKAGEGA